MGKVKSSMMKADESAATAANRYVEVVKEKKRLEKEEADLVRQLREYVSTTGNTLIGDMVMAYERNSAPKLVATDNGDVAVRTQELMAQLGDDYLEVKLSVKAIQAGMDRNKPLQQLMKKLKLEIQVSKDWYFKHV